MGGRLLPLLALLGAAVAVDWCARLNPCANGGTCSMVGSAWTCRCPGRWRGKRCQTGPEPAELAESSSPRPLSSLSSGRAKPTPRAPTWHPNLAASPAVEMPTDSTAAERASEAGPRERAKSPTPPGSSRQSHPATAAATKMPQARLAHSASPAGATAHGSSPSLPSEGDPGGRLATSPSQGLGTGLQVDRRLPVAEPSSEAMWADGTVTASPSLNPAGSPSHVELPGPSLAAVGWPVTGASPPGHAWSADSAKTPQEDIVALAELTRRGSAAPQTVGPEEFLWPPVGSEVYGESGLPTASGRPPEPWSAVGLLPPSAAPPESWPPPRSSVGPDLTKVEDTTPGDFLGSMGPASPHIMSLGQRTSVWEWQGPVRTPSAGVSRVAVSGSETTPHFTPSSSYAAATPTLSPDFLPYHTGHTPSASQLAPSSSLPSGRRGLSTGPTGETGVLGTGQDAKWNTAALQTSTDSLPVPGTEPLPAPNAPGTHKSMEPFSTGPDPAQPSPVLAQHPPNWAREGGAASYPASSSSGASVAGTNKAGLSSVSPRRPPAATSQDGFPREAALSQANQPAAETTETPEPAVRLTLGKGAPAAWSSPSLTESQANPASAAFTAREDSAQAGAPRLPSQTALFSSSASAVAVTASQEGKTEASGHFSVTRLAWSTPARTWRGSRGDPSTDSPGREAPPSPPMPTAGKTWQTWPLARGDPPVASTCLLAAVLEAATQLAPATPREVHPRVQHVFVAENQPPVLKAAFLHLPWELVLAMEGPRSLGSPRSPEYRGLLLSINATVAPLFAPLPGFQRLEVKSIRPSLHRPGTVVVLLDALFLAEAPGWRAALNHLGLSEQPPPGLWAANTSIAWSMALERPLDLCAELFSCPAGYDCVVGKDRNATCASVCHRQYCKNQGICTHAANQTPICQCPVGSDFWFLGVRCDYKVTQQGLLGVACGLLLSLLLIGAAVFGLVVRRVRLLLLEARVDQTKSSYRRFCRLDDVSAHYWSEPWLASVNSLDNPAFSNSEELLHLQILEPTCCSCQEGCMAAEGYRKPLQGGPSRRAAGRPRSLCSWERSSSSGNEHMIDSGKASEVSVSSWPMEPIQWSPSPALHEHACQPTHKSRRPHSYCEGMELINLERSWTA